MIGVNMVPLGYVISVDREKAFPEFIFFGSNSLSISPAPRKLFSKEEIAVQREKMVEYMDSAQKTDTNPCGIQRWQTVEIFMDSKY